MSCSPADRIAQSIGRCGKCQGLIAKGELFRWIGQPPEPRCQRCIEAANHRKGANLRNIR